MSFSTDLLPFANVNVRVEELKREKNIYNKSWTVRVLICKFYCFCHNHLRWAIYFLVSLCSRPAQRTSESKQASKRTNEHVTNQQTWNISSLSLFPRCVCACFLWKKKQSSKRRQKIWHKPNAAAAFNFHNFICYAIQMRLYIYITN